MKDIVNLILELADQQIGIFLEDGKLKIDAPNGVVLDAVIPKIKLHKDEIIKYLSANNGAKPVISIPRAPHSESYVLSSSQRRLWILSQFEESSIAYNIPGVFELEGVLDVNALSRSFDALVDRHEMLRTVFHERNGEVNQYIIPSEAFGFRIQYHDLRHSDEATINQVIKTGISRPFDLTSGPLLRADLYQLEDNKWIFTYVMHHIISDGWSMGILIKELLQLYNAFIQGTPDPLQPLRIHYKDYAVWQQQQLNEEGFQQHKKYWLQQLGGELPVLDFPADQPRPAVKTYNGANLNKTMDAGTTSGLKALCESTGSTLFMGLLATVKALLYRYTSQEDIIIGSPIANREHSDLEDQIGFYVNTLALRTQFSGTDSYRQLLSRVRQTTLDAYAHQAYPFDALLEELDLQTDMGRNALFDVMVVLQHESSTSVVEKGLYGLTLHTVEGLQQSSKFDLQFTFVEAGDQLELYITYNTDLYHSHTITRLCNHLEQLLSAILRDPLRPIEQLDYLSDAEKQQLLQEFSNASADYPEQKTLVELFEEQVERTPDSTAVIFEERTITYRQLNEQANRLAHYLIANHVIAAGDIIAIKLERTAWMVTAMLGVLKAGAAYLPIATDYPQDRIDYMLKDSGCKAIIDQQELDKFSNEMESFSGKNLSAFGLIPSSLAYVIYTSGSTGKPKGVMVEHRSVTALLENMSSRFFLKPGMVFGAVTSHTFDISVLELLGTLATGIQLHLIGDTSPLNIIEYIRYGKINALQITPSRLAQLADADPDLPNTLKNLKTLLVGGEALSQHTYEHLKTLEGTRVVNVYGPTETTVWSTSLELASGNRLSIGKPLMHENVLILDSKGCLSPICVAGEICIGGAGLARGYLNRPDLTAEKFILHPFKQGERTYKTGDLGRWLPDGNIEFLGRRDTQVKIRGYRIELGEIENVLQNYPGVKSAVVIARSDKDNEKELLAYFVGRSPVNVTALRKHMSEALPHYMVPGHFMQLDEIPLTHNGKINHKALPQPENFGSNAGMEFVAPRNIIEEKLAVIWKKILGKEKISVKDNFFDLGGHSLKVTRLASQVHKEFDVSIDFKRLFAVTALEDLAVLIGQSVRNAFVRIEVVEQQASYVLSSSQRRLWVLSQFEEASSAYNMPGVYLFEGHLDRTALEAAFASLTERHESLRTTFREDEQGLVRQFINPAGTPGFILNYFDLRSEEGREQAVRDLIQKELTRPFDLSAGPLLRVGLYQIEDNRWVFSYVMHHIISDGWSMNILIKELLQFYNAYSNGDPNPLAPLRIQYKDYAAWQQQQMGGANLQAHKNYWLKQFEGDLPVLELPSDKRRPAVKTYNGASVRKQIQAATMAGLKTLCEQAGSTLFMGLLAAVKTLLYRYTSQQDIIIGTPIAGREHSDLEDQIGFYVNTLALRTQFSGGESYQQLLSRIKQTTLDAYAHQAYPFDALLEELDVPRDLSRNALFDVMIVLQHQSSTSMVEKGLPGLQIRAYEVTQQVSKLDLQFSFVESGDQLGLYINYNTDLYHTDTIVRLSDHFERLLASIIAAPAKPIGVLPYLDLSEQTLLLETFNNTSVDYVPSQTVVNLIEEQALRTPDAAALVYEEKIFNYRELNETTNQLAHYLKHSYSIEAGDLVAIGLERSEWLPLVILGTLKAGAAYIPIDTTYPQQRIDYIIKDGNCKVFFDAAELEKFKDVQGNYDTTFSSVQTNSGDIAYCIYTSGSTGTPKGVLNTHGAIYNRLVWMKEYLGVIPTDVFLQKTPYTFDVSVWELLLPFMVGSTLVMAAPEKHKDPVYLQEVIAEKGVTIAHFVPSMLGALLTDVEADKCAGLKHIVCSGEELPASMVISCRSKLKDVRIHNLYGPTEAAIDVTAIDVTDADVTQGVSIGKPVANTKIHIVNEFLQLQPVGVAGELLISGVQVAKGYLHLEELTASRFINDPFIPGNRVYRSGDLARWLPDGTIQYLGRMDNQVKIRGNRIELGEVEKVLSTFPAIVQAIVTVRKVKDEKVLVAYYTSAEPIDKIAIRQYLQQKLPGFMVPGYYVLLTEVPLTASGKVDRKALPAIKEEDVIHREYVAPGNATERKLVSIWEEVLGRSGIGIKDNFFEMGGHSLKGMQVISRLYKELNVKVELKTLFSHPTIEALSRQVEQSEASTYTSIPVVAAAPYYDVSYAQKRLWVLSQFGESAQAYNMSMTLELKGKLDIPCFAKAFKTLVARHEILRTVFIAVEGSPKQKVLLPEECGFELECRTLLSKEDQASVARQWIQEESQKVFDLEKAPLLRAMLIQLEEEKHLFCFTMHHIISDGWSMEVLVREVTELYKRYREGEESHLPALKIQYKDYAAWQQQELSGEKLEAHRSYWLKQLNGQLPVLELPTDHPRPAVKTYNGSTLNFTLDKELASRLAEISISKGGSLFMTLVSTIAVLLHKYSGQDDIVLGTPTAGRHHKELEDQLGFYVNLLTLRTRIDKQASFEALVEQVKQNTLEAYEHQHYPFDKLVEELPLERDTSRSPLFDVMVVLQNTEAVTGMDELQIESYPVESRISKYDVSISFKQTAEGLAGVVEYNTDLFTRERIEKLIAHYKNLVKQLAEDIAIELSKVSLMSEEETTALAAFNDTEAPYPTDKTIQELFEQQAATTPQAPAVVYQGRSLSYQQLNEQSNQLAHYLRARYHIQPDDLIAVMTERSEIMVIALLAILKSGAAYVPIDPSYPEERIRYMLQDSGAKTLLYDSQATAPMEGLLLQDAIQQSSTYSKANPVHINKSNDLAYVIYTSGSTGIPKGVMIEHTSLVNLCFWHNNAFSVNEQSRASLYAAIGFDASVWELWPYLVRGASVYPVPEELRLKVDSLAEFIASSSLTHSFLPTPVCESLFQDESIDLPRDLWLLTGGDKLSKVKPGVRLVNNYGPTEGTVVTTSVLLEQEVISKGVIPIGRPVSNMKVWIMDDSMNQVPMGVVGEICISGAGLARGYLNKKEATAQKFVAERMYKTGDLGKWQPDGNILFLGRKDDQVKIRGYRIELGEIEQVLGAQAGIEQAVVLVKEKEAGEKYLVAYYTSKQPREAKRLRADLGRSLPQYMVPAYFMQLEHFPLTPNGKIDRKALPAPETQKTQAAYVAPRTETEEQLVIIWKKVLGLEKVGITDDFFESGGHSLNVTRMLYEINNVFDIKLQIKDVFASRTVQELAQLIDDEIIFKDGVAVNTAEQIINEKNSELWEI